MLVDTPAGVDEAAQELALTDLRVPAVRHLAWMCRAPQLLSDAQSFRPRDCLPPHWRQRLQAWEQSPHTGPKVLTDAPPRRLGLYFERLYACLMTELLGWELLASNIQIREPRTDGPGVRTLGELDFLLLNPSSAEVEHHEIAVKFYLGYAASARLSASGQGLWYGPNSRDRLDLKRARLLHHQSQMRHRSQTAEMLSARGLPLPTRARVFMPGYLFYPVGKPLTAPDSVGEHECGRWFYAHQLTCQSVQHWVPLHKPHWLGPWLQAEAPDPGLTRTALEQVCQDGAPRLFAQLAPDQKTGLWVETERVFVVPDTWPGARGASSCVGPA